MLPTVKLERIVTVPTSKQIASIDKEGFHQQQFKSATKVTTTKVHCVIVMCVKTKYVSINRINTVLK